MSEIFIPKPVFWSPVDPKIKGFFDLNSSLHYISEKYPYVFVSSGGMGKDILKKCPKAIVVNTQNDMKKKGTIAFDRIKDMDFHFLIRIDIDAIVFDLERLISLTYDTGPNQLVGRLIRRKNYIRGACQSCGVNLVKYLPPLGSGKQYDIAMSSAVLSVGGELVDKPLFEMNSEYRGDCPVWHPHKGKAAWRGFNQEIKKWKLK